jgi:AcrR family transcriptional regulator
VGDRYHHGNLRAALLAAAGDRLEQAGPGGISMRELARELEVSHGAPRAHFADREALLDALAADGFALLGAELDDALATRRGSFPERLTAFAGVYVGFGLAHPALLRLMFSQKERPGAAALRAANDRAFAAPIALIADAQANGEIDASDPDRVALTVLAMLQGLISLVANDMIGSRAPAAVIAGTVETLVRGLGVQPAA